MRNRPAQRSSSVIPGTANLKLNVAELTLTNYYSWLTSTERAPGGVAVW
jgi:hypothetical protein